MFIADTSFPLARHDVGQNTRTLTVLRWTDDTVSEVLSRFTYNDTEFVSDAITR